MNHMTIPQMRRAARAQGLAITTKGGGFMITDPATNTVVAGAWPNAYAMNANDVATYLTEENNA